MRSTMTLRCNKTAMLFSTNKIAEAIKSSVKASEGNIKEMLDDAAMAVMGLNGGSAVPLWNTWLDGMQEGVTHEQGARVDT